MGLFLFIFCSLTAFDVGEWRQAKHVVHETMYSVPLIQFFFAISFDSAHAGKHQTRQHRYPHKGHKPLRSHGQRPQGHGGQSPSPYPPPDPATMRDMGMILDTMAAIDNMVQHSKALKEAGFTDGHQSGYSNIHLGGSESSTGFSSSSMLITSGNETAPLLDCDAVDAPSGNSSIVLESIGQVLSAVGINEVLQAQVRASCLGGMWVMTGDAALAPGMGVRLEYVRYNNRRTYLPRVSQLDRQSSYIPP